MWILRTCNYAVCSKSRSFTSESPFNRGKSVWPCRLQKDKDALTLIDNTIPQFAQAGMHWVEGFSNVNLNYSNG